VLRVSPVFLAVPHTGLRFGKAAYRILVAIAAKARYPRRGSLNKPFGRISGQRDGSCEMNGFIFLTELYAL
jgi:hypothetical protein